MALEAAYGQCYALVSEGKANPYKPKDRIANLGEYHTLDSNVRGKRGSSMGAAGQSSGNKSFGELADEICSTITIQFDKLKMQLESTVAGLGISDKLEALGIKDSIHHENLPRVMKGTESVPPKTIIVGYSEHREPKLRVPRSNRHNLSFRGSIGQSLERNADLQNKSFDLASCLVDNEEQETPSYFIKVHQTPLKSVELLASCPQTGLIIIAGLGKTDLHQNRLIVAMDIKGVSDVISSTAAHTHQINQLLAKDGLVFSSSKDGFVKVWKSDTLENRLAIKHEGTVLSLDYDTANKRLFTCGKFGTIKVWNIPKNKEQSSIKVSDTTLPVMLRYLLIRDWLAICCGITGKILIYDLSERLIVGQIPGHTMPAFIALHYVPHTGQLVSTGVDGCIKIWDLTLLLKKKSVEVPVTTKHNIKNVCCDAAFDYEGQVAYLACSSTKILKSNLQNGKVLQSIDLVNEKGMKNIVAIDNSTSMKSLIAGCKVTGNIAAITSA